MRPGAISTFYVQTLISGAVSLSCALIGDEEEGPVFANGPAQRGAVNVAFSSQGGLRPPPSDLDRSR